MGVLNFHPPKSKVEAQARARPLPMPARVARRSTATFVVLVASSSTASMRAHCAALSPACTRRPAPMHVTCTLIGVIKLSELAGPEPTCEQGSLRLRSSRIMSSPIGTTRMCLRLATYILIPDRHQASPHRLLLHLLLLHSYRCVDHPCT